MKEETKKKISQTMKGRMPKNISLLHTKEIIEKVRKARIGLKHSEETKKKISSSMKGVHKGKKPWNYIDGRSRWLGPARYGDNWNRLRYLVYVRDKFTCQDCSIKWKPLDAHHIIPFLISYDNSLKNLITLCRSCHMKREQLNIKNRRIK